MEKSQFIEKLVHINRIAKVVKGGRRFGFFCANFQLFLLEDRRVLIKIWGVGGRGGAPKHSMANNGHPGPHQSAQS